MAMTQKAYLIQTITRIMAVNTLPEVVANGQQITVQQNPGDATAIQFSVDAGVTWVDTPTALAEIVYPDQAAAIQIEQTALDTAATNITDLTNLAGGYDAPAS